MDRIARLITEAEHCLHEIHAIRPGRFEEAYTSLKAVTAAMSRWDGA